MKSNDHVVEAMRAQSRAYRVGLNRTTLCDMRDRLIDIQDKYHAEIIAMRPQHARIMLSQVAQQLNYAIRAINFQIRGHEHLRERFEKHAQAELDIVAAATGQILERITVTVPSNEGPLDLKLEQKDA